MSLEAFLFLRVFPEQVVGTYKLVTILCGILMSDYFIGLEACSSLLYFVIELMSAGFQWPAFIRLSAWSCGSLRMTVEE